MIPSFIPKIVMMNPYELDPAPFNPPSRTSTASLVKLEQGIKEVGGIVVPLIASKDKRLIDGHRRLAVAKKIGLKEVPVIISSLSLQQGWVVANDTSMGVGSRDWVHLHYSGVSLEYIPRSHALKIAQVKELIGEEGFMRLAEAGMATSALDVSRMAVRYITGKSGRDAIDNRLLSKTLVWIIQHNQQAATRAAITSQISPRVLQWAIENDEPISKTRRVSHE